MLLRHTVAGGYRGAEVRSKKTVFYGTLTVRMKTGKTLGVLSTVFLYGSSQGKVHEIDIELLPENPSSPHFTSYSDWEEREDYVDGPHYYHVQPELAGFDCRQWHVYTIDWSPNEVVWMIDGLIVARTRKVVPARPLSIMFNFWHSRHLNKAKPDQDSEQVVDWVRWKDAPRLGNAP